MQNSPPSSPREQTNISEIMVATSLKKLPKIVSKHIKWLEELKNMMVTHTVANSFLNVTFQHLIYY